MQRSCCLPAPHSAPLPLQLVVSYNTVRRQELVDVKDQLLQTGCPIIGTVLNMVEFDNYISRKYYYKSYYSHYDRYQPDEDEGDQKKKKKESRKKQNKA